MEPTRVRGTQADLGAVLVMLDSPTNQEDDQDRPASSMSARYAVTETQKRWKGDIIVDYSIRCATRGRKPKPAHTDACRRFTAHTVQELKPKFILCFGAEAIRSIVGRSYTPMASRKGHAILQNGTPVFFFLHPHMTAQNKFVRSWLTEDMDWAFGVNTDNGPFFPRALCHSTVREPPLNGKLIFLETVEDVEYAVQECREAGGVNPDLETFGRPFNKGSRILDCSLTPFGSDDAFILESHQIYDPAMWAPVKALMEDKAVGKCNQHIKYDAVWMQAHLNTRVYGIVADTRMFRKMVSSHTETSLLQMQPLVGMAGGKSTVDEYVKAGAAELEKLALKPATVSVRFPELPHEELTYAVEQVRKGVSAKAFAYAAIPKTIRARYAGIDTVSTERLRQVLERQMADMPGVTETWKEVVIGMNHAITQMEFNGVAVSRLAITSLQNTMEGTVRAIRKRLDETVGVDFSPNSPQQVGKLLFETLRLKVPGSRRGPKLTKSGQYSCTAKVLTELDHPIARDICAYKKAHHFKVQYADTMLTFVQDDNRIHPAINLDGTVSGRASCDSPNLFNIPKATSTGKLCKDVFIATPGHVLLEVDQSQVELRVAAMLSGDDAMIQLFRDGVDFHLGTARKIAHMSGLKAEDITKEHPLRNRAKSVNFGVSYGMTATALANSLGCSAQEAQAVMDAVLGAFPKLKKFIADRTQQARINGYCRTWWNNHYARFRWVPEIGSADEMERVGAERSAFNTEIQGTAAEFTNASLATTQYWLDENPSIDAKLVLTVYDSILIEVREDQLALVAGKVKSIMESWPSLNVPFIAEAKVGYSWGSMEDYHVP